MITTGLSLDVKSSSSINSFDILSYLLLFDDNHASISPASIMHAISVPALFTEVNSKGIDPSRSLINPSGSFDILLRPVFFVVKQKMPALIYKESPKNVILCLQIKGVHDVTTID